MLIPFIPKNKELLGELSRAVDAVRYVEKNCKNEGFSIDTQGNRTKKLFISANRYYFYTSYFSNDLGTELCPNGAFLCLSAVRN